MSDQRSGAPEHPAGAETPRSSAPEHVFDQTNGLYQADDPVVGATEEERLRMRQQSSEHATMWIYGARN